MWQGGPIRADPRYTIERRTVLVCFGAVGLFSVLLAIGHVHLAGRLEEAASLTQDPGASAMILSLRRVLRGSALVLFSFGLLMAVGFQNALRLIKQLER